MSTYKFRKAAVGDLNRIAEIYSNILDLEEAGKATTGWVRDIYPTRETALEGIDAEEMFVLEDESTIVAAARINQEQVPEYANASWEHTEAPDDKVMVLHTLVVDPTLSGQGYGSAFVRFYEDYAAKHGCPYLRMDTNERNATARRLYAHLGYREAGIVACTFNGIRSVHLVCLEKTLQN